MSKDMVRLSGTVAAIAETVDIEVKFDIDAQGLNYFNGTLSTSVELICQRCNEQFAHVIQTDFNFSPVKPDANEGTPELPEVYEPVEVNDHGEVNILELFEDELILALPIVALHAEEDCNIKRDDMSFGKIDTANERPNPFAVLKELKRD